MNPEFVQYYTSELRYLREEGSEFARNYEKIAARLGLTEFLSDTQVADPYVERLLEGFAFLTARLHLKLDAQFPVFTQNLLDIVYPNYLAPRPSMAVVHFEPDHTEAGLADGFTIPRDSRLVASGMGRQTPCYFQTAQDVALWPLRVVDASYVPNAASVSAQVGGGGHGALAAVRLRLEVTAGLRLKDLSVDELPIFLTGDTSTPGLVMEQLLGNGCGVRCVADVDGKRHTAALDASQLTRDGFDDHQAMLPQGNRQFAGYRLLEEYFGLPQRFHFVRLNGLSDAFRGVDASVVDIFFLLDRSVANLDALIDGDAFALHCTPAVNLFRKRCDRAPIDVASTRHHIVPDRVNPIDFEIHSLEEVVGYGDREDEQLPFAPMYGLLGSVIGGPDHAYYSTTREQRVLSSKERRLGARAPSYLGAETFLTLSDGRGGSHPASLRQLAVTALCTNRDLPIQITRGAAGGDFTLETGGPLQRITALAGPTTPAPSRALGNQAWLLLSYLSLNYLSLGSADGAPDALKTMLLLHCDLNDPVKRRQIDGVVSVASRPITARIPGRGPIAFARGMRVDMECEESAFEGSSAFVLGAVLEQFLARYVSINSFTQLTVKSVNRGEVMTWPVRPGVRSVL